jgi:hypothetical protein
MGLKICLDEDLYRFLAGVHFHSDRVIAKIYLMPTTVLASNNGVRHFPPPSEGISKTYSWRCTCEAGVYELPRALKMVSPSATRRVQNGLKESKSGLKP